ncbi:head GIN domain-containing protein [Roseivirga sp. BDSF3-8]|uniref:head GIN domain-containing protein n=1 Tax=Roseivirga sp. BDSF3-8 TaxID=3241598 RepID=UPI003531A7D7
MEDIRRHILSCIIVLAGLVTACNDPDAPDCFKQRGEIVDREVSLPSFSAIEVRGMVEVVLTSGTEQKVSLRAGEKLIEEITLEVEQGVLRIDDRTSCNWVREYADITVHISRPSLRELTQRGSGSIRSEGVFLTDSLDIRVLAGTGDIDLNITGKDIFYLNNSLANVMLSGSVHTFTAHHYFNDAILHSENLRSSLTEIQHRGSNDMFLRADKRIRGTIESTGSVYCLGQPGTVEVTESGYGELVLK